MNTIPDFGEHGGNIIADTTSIDGKWFCIEVISACVFTTLTSATVALQGTLGSISWPAGFMIFGDFSTIRLASGSVIAYKSSP